ncbi:Pr6Pr family membrane protein [Bosea sp. LjRoot237]|uniref:Pr6Pr family membrane protein n=1 Tax=Bosea sp. LjRoot237 TaxID=3342292 RepID=UPI003ECE79C0
MRIVAAGGAIIGWAVLALQFYLIAMEGAEQGWSSAEVLARFFNFFTILTNILVASTLTQAALAPGRGILGRPPAQAAVASYIVVVWLIYFTLLRRIWAPAGLQWQANIMLHYVMPALYVGFWLAFVRKGRLRWAMAVAWLAYPLLYLAWALIRGAVSGFYPYPFINAAALGYERVALNALGIAGVFLVIGLVFVALDRLLARSGGADVAATGAGRRAPR